MLIVNYCLLVIPLSVFVIGILRAQSSISSADNFNSNSNYLWSLSQNPKNVIQRNPIKSIGGKTSTSSIHIQNSSLHLPFLNRDKIESWTKGEIKNWKRGNNQNRSQGTFIEGTGPFKCIFENYGLSSSIRNDPDPDMKSRLIKNVGKYRCHFPFPEVTQGIFKGTGSYECFFGNYFEYFQGTGNYNCKFWLEPVVKSSSIQNKNDVVKNSNSNLSNELDVDLIEGTGSYLCIFRGSELGGQEFVRNVGNFRCNLQGGQKTKNMVVGFGYYQCHFQKQGDNLILRSGIGLYVCFLAGVRKVKGLTQEITPPKSKDSFFEILGSFQGSINNTNEGFALSRPQGDIQLLGLYQFGPEGSAFDVGFIQALESYRFDLQNQVESNSQNQLSGVRSSVNQLGQFQYAFKGTQLAEGRRQINQNVGYTIRRTWADRHSLNLLMTLHDFAGQSRRLGQNEDFVQFLIYYEFDQPESTYTDVQLMSFSQFDLQSGQLDWTQLIGEIDWDFLGPNQGQGSLGLAGVYQSGSIDPSGIYEIGSDLILLTFNFLYTAPGSNPGETGLVRVYAIYNYYLELVQERAGWIMFLFEYNRIFPRDLTLNQVGQGSVRIFSVFEVNFPNVQLTNSMWHILMNYAIDLNDLGTSLTHTGSTVPGAAIGVGFGILTFSGLVTGLSFGFGDKVNYIYYIILYVTYEVNLNVIGVNRVNGSFFGGDRNAKFVMRYFEEIRNDNVQS